MVSAKSAIENFQIVRLDHGTLHLPLPTVAEVEERDGYSYVEAHSNTGYKYIVVASPLGSHAAMELGGEVIVSLLAPHQAVAVMNPFFLTCSYVADKFAHDLYQWRPSDVVCVTRAVGLALGVEDDADTAHEYLEKP